MKRRRATKIQRLKRTQRAIDLIVKHGASSTQIIQVLTQNSEDPISERTAWNTLQKARSVLAGLGSQPTSEERGLLIESAHDLFVTEQNSGNPDRKLQNQILRTLLEIYKTHPHLKGGPLNAQSSRNTEEDPLSSQLKKILDQFGSTAADSEPETGS